MEQKVVIGIDKRMKTFSYKRRLKELGLTKYNLRGEAIILYKYFCGVRIRAEMISLG